MFFTQDISIYCKEKENLLLFFYRYYTETNVYHTYISIYCKEKDNLLSLQILYWI